MIISLYYVISEVNKYPSQINNWQQTNLEFCYTGHMSDEIFVATTLPSLSV